jgi:hypothetical protein
LWPVVRLLLSDASKPEILANSQSTSSLHRRLAIAGAIRNSGGDDQFLEEVWRSLCLEERDEMSSLMDTLGKFLERNKSVIRPK